MLHLMAFRAADMRGHLPRTVICLILIAGCARETTTISQRVAFVMCPSSANNATQLKIDFNTKAAVYQDVTARVAACGTSSSCVGFPVVLSRPPRLSDTPGDIVTWADGGHRFTLSVLSKNEYSIRSVSPPQVTSMGTFPPMVQNLNYDTDIGVRSVQIERGHAWITCGGHLRFEDIDGLLP